MTHVTARFACAIRTARSISVRTWPGTVAVMTYSVDVAEQRLQIDFLLVAEPERRAGLLPDDRHHGDMIGLRVIQAGQQMNGAGTGGRVAQARAGR